MHGNIIGCRDEVLPSPELCDRKDNDCDSSIDEGPIDEILGETCGPPDIGICSPGVYKCTVNGIECVGGKGPEPESCNGEDDDCNGLRDDLPEDSLSFCYDGPPETSNVLPCHPGVTKCVDGQVICTNQQRPEPERCDGIDQDCDGIADDGLTDDPDLKIDIMLGVDISGSMRSRLPPVREAITTFLDWMRTDDRYRFALLSFPLDYSGSYRVHSDLTDAGSLVPFVGALAQNGLSNEYLYDISYALAVGDISLSWRPGSVRIQIFITDERGRSKTGLTETELATALVVAGHRFYVFALSAHVDVFDEPAVATLGSVFDFPEDDPEAMADDLSTIVIGVCLP